MSMTASALAIRPVAEEDIPILMSLILELAEYEKLTDILVATEESLKEVLFGPRPVAEAILGYCDGEAVGYAFFFHNCSTFLGRMGMYLEDIYVRPSVRGRGLGKMMLVHVAKLARERGCGRMEWTCLDWNKPSIEFYKSLGAEQMDEWTIFRLTGKDLDRVAEL